METSRQSSTSLLENYLKSLITRLLSNATFRMDCLLVNRFGLGKYYKETIPNPSSAYTHGAKYFKPKHL